MCQNIDDFNRVAELDTHEDLAPEESEWRDQRHAIYGAAVQFLADEGYLRFAGQAVRNQLFTGMVLTSKGFAVLQKTPDSLRQAPSGTIGDSLVAASQDLLKDGTKELLRQAIPVILG